MKCEHCGTEYLKEDLIETSFGDWLCDDCYRAIICMERT